MKSGGGESKERQAKMDAEVNVGRLRQERMGNGLTKWVWNECLVGTERML